MTDTPPPESNPQAPRPDGSKPRRRRRRRKKSGSADQQGSPNPAAASGSPQPPAAHSTAGDTAPAVPQKTPPVRRNRPKPPPVTIPSATNESHVVKSVSSKSRKPRPPRKDRNARPPRETHGDNTRAADRGPNPNRSNNTGTPNKPGNKSNRPQSEKKGQRPPEAHDGAPRPGDTPPAKKRKKRKLRTKDCLACYTPHTTIHRVRVNYRKQWAFICDICWADRCVDNPHYEYGGLWISGRVMTPESELHAERLKKRQKSGKSQKQSNPQSSPSSNAEQPHNNAPHETPESKEPTPDERPKTAEPHEKEVHNDNTPQETPES